jgi:hypothetical protein
VKRSHKKNAGHPITHAHGQDEDDPSAQPAHQQRGSASDFIKKIYMMLTYPELLIDKIKSSGAGEGGAGGEEGGGGASVKTEFSVEWLKGIVDWQDDGMKFRVKQIPLFTEWILCVAVSSSFPLSLGPGLIPVLGNLCRTGHRCSVIATLRALYVS